MNAAYAPGLASVPGVPAGASAAAGHSLGEAYAVAGRLGGERGELLRQAARHSFVQGLHVTLLVSAGLLLAGAVMALRLPRVMQCVDPEQDAAPEKPVQGVRSRRRVPWRGPRGCRRRGLSGAGDGRVVPASVLPCPTRD